MANTQNIEVPVTGHTETLENEFNQIPNPTFLAKALGVGLVEAKNLKIAHMEEQGAIDFSKIDSHIVDCNYQFTSNNENIVQVLPSSATGQKTVLIIHNLFGGNTDCRLTLRPSTGENIEGTTGDFDLEEDGYQGFLLNEGDGGWHFYQKPQIPETETTFTKPDGSQTFKAQAIKSQDGSIEMFKLPTGEADFSVNALNVSEGVFAKLGTTQTVNTDFKNERPYFADMQGYMKNYIGFDKTKKAFTVQEGDMKDPNKTGGTLVRVGMNIVPIDQPVASENGYAELKLVNVTTGDYLRDENNELIATRIQYKQGDVITKEHFEREFRAKGQVEIAFEVNFSFSGQEIVLASESSVYIQTVLPNKLNLFEMAWCQFNGITVKTDNRYYGYNFINLAQELVKSKSEKNFNGTEKMGNGLFLSAENTKVKIEDYTLKLSDNGNIPTMSVGFISDIIDNKALKGLDIKTSIDIKNSVGAVNVSMLNWNGTGKPIFPILTGYSNANPVFATGWTVAKTEFIAENPLQTFVKHPFVFPVGTTQKLFAIIIYPTEAQSPTNIEIKDFEGDILPWFNKSIIKDSGYDEEMAEKYKDEIYGFENSTPSGDISFRYTANPNTKAPLGIVKKGGEGHLVNNNAWYTSTDEYKNEGDLLVKVDGIIEKWSRSIRAFNETNTDNTISLYVAKSKSDGTFEEVPNTRWSDVIKANTTVPTSFKIPNINFKVKQGEIYRTFFDTDKSDGFYLQSGTDGVPLLENVIQFKALSEDDNFIQEIIGNNNSFEIVDGNGVQLKNKIIRINSVTKRIDIIDK